MTTEFFYDGFETGDMTSWGGATVCAATNVGPHHGTYCTTGSIQLLAEGSYCYKNLGVAYASLYGRVYVRLGSALPATWTICGLRFGSAADSFIVASIVDCANNKWGIRILNTVATSYWEAASTMTIVANKWYCVELYVNIADAGKATLWVDGVPKLTGTYDNNAAGNARIVYARVGLLNANEAAPINVGFDCCVFADAYIGPEKPLFHTLKGRGGDLGSKSTFIQRRTRPPRYT